MRLASELRMCASVNSPMLFRKLFLSEKITTFQIVFFRKIVELYARRVSSVLFLAVYYFLTDSKNRSQKGYDRNAKDAPRSLKLQASRRGQRGGAAGAVTTGGDCTLSSVDRTCNDDGS